MSKAESMATTQVSEEAKLNKASDEDSSAAFTKEEQTSADDVADGTAGQGTSTDLKDSDSKGINQNDSENGDLEYDEGEEENESDDEDFPKFGDTARGRVAGPVAGQKPTNNRPR